MKSYSTGIAALALVLVNCTSEGPSSFAPADQQDQELSSSSNTKLATGWGHACTIYRGGRIICWGANGSGQLGNGAALPQVTPIVLVNGITTATAVAAGQGFHTDDYGDPTNPTALSHTCALLSDGTVKCWGRNKYGQLGNGSTTDSSSPVTVSGISGATAIAAGTDHTCALLSTGVIKCWGYNASGQLGNNTTTNATTPVQVSGISTATAVALGGLHSCARLSDSTLRCWGEGASGRLGNASTSDQRTPVTVSGITTATAIAGGDAHTCARLSDSTIKCWGEGGNGQLGRSSTSDSTTPVAVSGITNAVAIGLGDSHTCAKLSTGALKCWGKNDLGQLGDGTTTQRTSPVSVSGITNADEVSGGTGFTCATLTTGSLRCWGSNRFGQLAQGNAGIHPVPFVTDRLSLNKVMAVAPGWHHSCVLWGGIPGSVKCWGENTHGQLGNGTTTYAASAVDVIGITDAVEVVSGQDHSCARLSSGSIKCWGNNDSGQLGNGTWTDSSTPVSVSSISTASQMGLGAYHSCAVLADKTIKCWGNNGDGQLGAGCSFSCSNQNTPVTVGGSINTAVAVGAGAFQSCALLSNGTVKCWGNNSYGELGNGSFSDSKSPVTVSGLSNVTAFGVGNNHGCALLSDATVKCWGRNEDGRLGNGKTTNSNVPVAVSGLSDVTQIVPAGYHTCAMQSDKTVKCWGRNAESQLGDGTMVQRETPVTATGLSSVDKLAMGSFSFFSCVRRNDATLMCWGSNEGGQMGNGWKNVQATPVEPVCHAVEVERSDYFLSITTANMPDPALDGQSAQLDMHRVKPLFFPETCAATQGLVMVHGRTVEAVSAFDLQYQDYSFMETMALQGIDTFAMNHLGMGRSSGLGVMDNSCNASLPSCTSLGQTCPPPNGVLCDCGPVPTFGINDQDQQGSTRYLNPNPLSSRCAHSFNTRFTRTTAMVAEVDVAVDDALAKTGLSKVNILGYSAGGVDVGNYLGDANATVRAAHTAKIERAIFVSSLFGLPTVTATEPSGGSAAHSYPFGLMDRSSATAGGFNLGTPTCPGQRDDGIIDPIWASVKARDTVGADWGPSQTPAANGGLSRFPHATRWGWNADAAKLIGVPVLVMQGLKDNVIPVVTSANLYNALRVSGTNVPSSAIVQIECGSHSIFWEGCSGAQCNGWTGAHASIAKNAHDYIKTGMIYASPGSADGSWGGNGTDGANYHTVAPTEDGPAASEENQLP
jgi:alpha-tubulin suppressor-like RCC1 family protein/pimeloyl-ACP methyl ester carboxylesterase